MDAGKQIVLQEWLLKFCGHSDTFGIDFARLKLQVTTGFTLCEGENRKPST